MKKIAVGAILVIFVISFSIFCNISSRNGSDVEFLNLNDSVGYVGINVCRTCHEDVYTTYMHTAMGESFDFATHEKSAASYSTNISVYDSVLDFYYTPFWRADTLMVLEYRITGDDTTHKRIERISYVIGSGHHTNSHIIDINGYLYQAPITYYTQQEVWDLAPGFDGGFNTRFTRPIGLECMTCHNGFPDFETGSINKFNTVKRGIDCERCHGPGELHVTEKLAGIIIDTSKNIDPTIVNPAHLSRSLQMSICQRCHLQGITVLKDGSTYEDFRPGMHLSEVMDVFIPKYELSEEKFIMASQADRLMKSKCYKHSETMSCITCHNPHVSVRETAIQVFNQKCNTCHDVQMCTEKKETRLERDDNCIACHMQQSESIDIPHIAITDHFIRIPKVEAALADSEITGINRFIELACLTSDRPSNKTIAKAYLSYHEKYSGGSFTLDSAIKYLEKVYDPENPLNTIKETVQYYFAKDLIDKVIAQAEKVEIRAIDDGWTYYRIGEAYYSRSNFKKAYLYYDKAVVKDKYNLNFQNKLGATYMQLGEIHNAKFTFEGIVKSNPKHVAALSNLGFAHLKLGDPDKAELFYNRAIALDPDYIPAILNKVGLLIYRGEYEEAKELTKKILKKDPFHPQAIQILQQLSALG
ncbi:MAG: tetratricopeptide repeat protein [Bacteroidetes bacterium]|nr:tetratricopeptide repeat protein [Bacteroidota bacterium]